MLPSIFATNDLGERFTRYSLESQTIAPFIESQIVRASHPEPSWDPLTDDVLAELALRSIDRVNQSEEFAEINEQLAKLAEENDVVHLADWIKEREEAENAPSTEPETDATKTDSSAPGDDKTDTEDETAPTESGESATTQAHDEDSMPSPQREEALRILADLIDLQENAQSSWHEPQSASRSESSSLLQ